MKNFKLFLSVLMLLICAQVPTFAESSLKGVTPEKFEFIQKLAAAGDAKLQHVVGLAYYEGEIVAKDYNKARDWFEKAAANGMGISASYVANMYFDGIGVVQSYEMAKRWHIKAAENGFRESFTFLGFMVAIGQGQKSDPIEACMWFNLGKDEGELTATKMLDELSQKMTPKQIADAKAMSIDWRLKRPKSQ
ncbi:tetratricopeptide repeat protein [Asticcacaulis machinosus]|uniref:Tetratricopeptide repeat protein n=1 Tax=Asticcacaulis machinosus TaxID=2984211 RepID=A0ABT5HLV8_9CAUL|nr:tetratricopeptide repeat protein [Asticcacaulis machinosus]MDC7676988.1 tetratricopeptide repeat protein [Asticcacaulis machinosus]